MIATPAEVGLYLAQRRSVPKVCLILSTTCGSKAQVLATASNVRLARGGRLIVRQLAATRGQGLEIPLLGGWL